MNKLQIAVLPAYLLKRKHRELLPCRRTQFILIHVKEVSARSLLLDFLIRALKRPARLVEEIACKISSGDGLVPDLIDLCNFLPRLVQEIEHEGKGLRGRHCWWEDNDQLANFLEINNNRRDTMVILIGGPYRNMCLMSIGPT
jgi:hypothetical protein